jgi:hypothetical protein
VSYLWHCKSCSFTSYENRDYVMHRLATGHDRTFEETDTGPYVPPGSSLPPIYRLGPSMPEPDPEGDGGTEEGDDDPMRWQAQIPTPREGE